MYQNKKILMKHLVDDASFSNEFKNSFNSLPNPTSELDWLANYKEQGQTYDEFLDDCPFHHDDNNRRKIYLFNIT